MPMAKYFGNVHLDFRIPHSAFPNPYSFSIRVPVEISSRSNTGLSRVSDKSPRQEKIS